MCGIDEVVLICHQTLLDDKGIKSVSSPDMKMSRANGIDSLGIVTLILDIEEKLAIDLDNYLTDIRNSYYLKELIDIVQRCVYETK
jgi:acyl carrier protein